MLQERVAKCHPFLYETNIIVKKNEKIFVFYTNPAYRYIL